MSGWKRFSACSAAPFLLALISSSPGFPLPSATSAWIGRSDQPKARYGLSISGAGDVNGDGYADVLVVAPNYVTGEEEADRVLIGQGRVFLYCGSRSGLSAVPVWTKNEGATSAASAGDVNGDGYDDIIIGARLFGRYGHGNEGRALLHLGSAAGPADVPAWVFMGEEPIQFGGSVATAGDVNGDGFDDVIVGAIVFSHPEEAEGRACVFHGSAGGLSAVPAWTAEGNGEFALFGQSVASAGDVNGDGYADVIVGSRGSMNKQEAPGRAYVFHGSQDGLSREATWIATGKHSRSSLGMMVASAGDVNGDGDSDILVNESCFDCDQTSEGRALVYHGSHSGLSDTPAWRAEGNQAYAAFGRSLAGLGDVNGDGFDDVIVGAPTFSDGEKSEGGAFIFFGSPAGLSPDPAWRMDGDQPSAILGNRTAGPGDINGDGFADVLVSAQDFDVGNGRAGTVFLEYGRPRAAAWNAVPGDAAPFCFQPSHGPTAPPAASFESGPRAVIQIGSAPGS